LDLAIGLPLRNAEGLKALLGQIYDPASPKYRKYLAPQQFTAMFGPTEEDYQRLIDFAKSNGFAVTGTHPNRTLLDVNASAGEIEKTFRVRMLVYQHPREARTFYAPDIEPTIDLAIPILHISGLDNYTVPHPNLMEKPHNNPPGPTPNAGSGPSGSYLGRDFRAAYAPGVALTGAGQSVGLLQFDGYYTNDIAAYESLARLTNVVLTNVLVGGFSGVPTGNALNVGEVSLDIEMVISMAPGLSAVIVYEGSTNTPANTILNKMATTNLASQLSASWTYGINASTEQIFQQFAAQGQSFFNASGDTNAYAGTVATPADDPYITIVGGTTLTTTGPEGTWVSETTWNSGNSLGSSGGISTTYAIPAWQQGIDTSSNQGSTSFRNIPDVAMIANNVWVISNNGRSNSVVGTSIATPLWAAFTALANEQAAANGKPPVGFVNPAIYSFGKDTTYTSFFHDITTGNNTNSISPTAFFAVAGYDLCTGWGTPTGANLIHALAGPVWVAFGNSDPGDGTFARPYNTLAQATNTVAVGGTIMSKTAGSTPEMPTITKPLTIRAVGGAATIGQTQ
jgi:subtilase family serine protease